MQIKTTLLAGRTEKGRKELEGQDILFEGDFNTIGECLQEAVKQGVDLAGANLRDANLKFLNLENAKLSHALFEGATITNCNFAKADLSRGHFDNAIIKTCNFWNADLRNAIFDEAIITGNNLTYNNTLGASFKKTYGFIPPLLELRRRFEEYCLKAEKGEIEINMEMIDQ